jgi:hypothetical protein
MMVLVTLHHECPPKSEVPLRINLIIPFTVTFIHHSFGSWRALRICFKLAQIDQRQSRSKMSRPEPELQPGASRFLILIWGYRAFSKFTALNKESPQRLPPLRAKGALSSH